MGMAARAAASLLLSLAGQMHEQVISNTSRPWARCIVLCNLWFPGTLARTKVVVPLLLANEFYDESFEDRLAINRSNWASP